MKEQDLMAIEDEGVRKWVWMLNRVMWMKCKRGLHSREVEGINTGHAKAVLGKLAREHDIPADILAGVEAAVDGRVIEHNRVLHVAS